MFENCFNSTASTRFNRLIPHSGESAQAFLARRNAECSRVQVARSRFCAAIFRDYQFVWKDPLAQTGPKEVCCFVVVQRRHR